MKKEIKEIEKIIKSIFKKGKFNFACMLNELEENNKSPDYLRAIKDIKERTKISGTMLELFRF